MDYGIEMRDRYLRFYRRDDDPAYRFFFRVLEERSAYIYIFVYILELNGNYLASLIAFTSDIHELLFMKVQLVSELFGSLRAALYMLTMLSA